MSRLAVVVPAHNEAEELPRTLTRLNERLAAPGRAFDLVVVDNASTDATVEVAREHGARVVHEPHRQISRVRNTGAAHTEADWLLFVDADTWPSRELLARSLELLEGGACGGGALVAMDRLPNRVYTWGLRAWNAVAARFSFAAGCFVFVRRDAFEAVGGFDERYYAGDEVILSRRLKRWGRQHGHAFVVLREPAVSTSARKAHWFSPAQHVLTTLIVLLCPPAMRSRRLMWFWYRRPGE